MEGNGPLSTLEGLCRWAAERGFTCVQIPAWTGLIDLGEAARSQTYCDDYVGRIQSYGLVDGVSELAMHPTGQTMAVHPAYHSPVSAFAPESLRSNPRTWRPWAVERHKLAIKASAKMKLNAIPTFTGSFLWPYIYPWPQGDERLIDRGFTKQGEIWGPIFDYAGEMGQRIAFELHPGEDVFSGTTFLRLLQKVGNHPACALNLDISHFILMALKWREFIEKFHDRIAAFHAKDAELIPTAYEGVYSFETWVKSARRFRSLGDGQGDFELIWKLFKQFNIDVPWVLEWEDPLKPKEQGAREGAAFIKAVLDETALPAKTQPQGPVTAFDDFAKGEMDPQFVSWIFGEDYKLAA